MFSSVTWMVFRNRNCCNILENKCYDLNSQKECGDLYMCVIPVTTCHHCYFSVVGNKDDSNRNDKKYVNSHLLCFLEAKT